MSEIIIPSKKGKNGIGVGVWNLRAGCDPFGGPTRAEIPILDLKKVAEFRSTQRYTALAGYLAECLY
jgi:hypothetical protein